MTISISTALADLSIGTPVVFNNLAMVPLFLDRSNESIDYLCLDEGLETDEIDVEELEEGASVSDILFRNKSDQFALLFEGEELLGAKQNRILNVSVLVTPKTTQKLPVSCVEAGRWRHEHCEPGKQRFRSANRMHYARGRASVNRAASFSADRSGEFRSDQSEVWADIEMKSSRMRVESPTSASDAMYASSRIPIDEYLKEFTPAPNQVGSVFLVDGRVLGMEVFATEEIHTKMFAKLVRSYALDALDPVSPLNRSKESISVDQCAAAANEFRVQLSDSWTKKFDGVCAGQNCRIKDERVTGGALIHDEQVLHLCAFTLPEYGAHEAVMPNCLDPE